MRNKKLVISLFLISFLMVVAFAGKASGIVTQIVTLDFGDITLTSSGATDSGYFDPEWCLTGGDMVISFTYDANGLVDDSGTHAWAELGLRAIGYGDFNPTWMVEGAGVWLATDYDWAVNTFDPDTLVWYGPPYNGWYGTQDMDDKLILQKGGGMGEGTYDLPSSPAQNWNNYGIWFDRDGYDPYQPSLWGALNGQTYNTAGLYNVVITLHATSATTGTAYITVNGVPQGFYNGPWFNGQPTLYPAGMTFTFPADTCMQVFYGLYGYGATHSVAFRDITVTGAVCVAVGGEWIPVGALQLLTPWISLATTMAIAVSYVCGKRLKRQQN